MTVFTLQGKRVLYINYDLKINSFSNKITSIEKITYSKRFCFEKTFLNTMYGIQLCLLLDYYSYGETEKKLRIL